MESLRLTRLAVLFCILFPFSAFAATHDVMVGNNFFSPNDLTIEVGDTVRWTNNSGRTHDVTADDGSFNSPTSSSFTFQRTFNSVAEILYHCSVHSAPGRNRNSNQNGRITVVEADPGQPPTAAFSSNCTGLDCNFTDQSSDSDGTISSRSWTFGDGGNSSMQNPSHSYAAAGTYSVMLTVTDNDGNSDSESQNVMVSEPLPDPIKINIGMSDAWFYPITDGQGFFIIVWEGIKFIFLSWFTFDTERPPEDVMAILGDPGHRWLVAQGPYEGDTALLDVFLSAGGVFDFPVPPVEDPVAIGTITIKWTSCNSAILTYDIPSLGLMSEIPIERIVPEQNVPLCEAGQDMP